MCKEQVVRPVLCFMLKERASLIIALRFAVVLEEYSEAKVQQEVGAQTHGDVHRGVEVLTPVCAESCCQRQ